MGVFDDGTFTPAKLPTAERESLERETCRVVVIQKALGVYRKQNVPLDYIYTRTFPFSSPSVTVLRRIGDTTYVHTDAVEYKKLPTGRTSSSLLYCVEPRRHAMLVINLQQRGFSS